MRLAPNLMREEAIEKAANETLIGNAWRVQVGQVAA